MKYVAVVHVTNRPSKRKEGDWASFIADTPDNAMLLATEAIDAWGMRGRYAIGIGPLTHEASYTPSCSFHEYQLKEVIYNESSEI